MIYNVFTDGACSPNPGKGGWAFIAYPKEHPNNRIVRSGFESESTNNRMEMTAIIMGIKYILMVKNPDSENSIELYSDSKYVLQGMQSWMHKWQRNGWKKKTKGELLNVDLWKEIYSIWNKIEIQCNYIKGHSGHLENEECDQLAVKEIENHV